MSRLRFFITIKFLCVIISPLLNVIFRGKKQKVAIVFVYGHTTFFWPAWQTSPGSASIQICCFSRKQIMTFYVYVCMILWHALKRSSHKVGPVARAYYLWEHTVWLSRFTHSTDSNTQPWPGHCKCNTPVPSDHGLLLFSGLPICCLLNTFKLKLKKKYLYVPLFVNYLHI